MSKQTQIDERLKNKAIRPTAIRELVLQSFLKNDAALSLTDLELQLERADKSTLFRTLKTFEDKKLIHSIDDGSGSLKYALCHECCQSKHEDQHIHFLCSRCQRTFCVTECQLPAINLPSGFSPESIHIVIQGICPHCKNKNED